MKTGTCLIALSLSLGVPAESPAVEPMTEAEGASPSPAVRGRIIELLKQDVLKIPPKPKEVVTPPFAVAPNDQPVAESILELEKISVTQKKPIELPLRLRKLTLDNFLQGDGTIVESADQRFSLSAGPERRGLAAIKFNLKF